MAKTLARQIGYRYIDSGAMYRAVTLYALRNSLISAGLPDTAGITMSLSKIDINFRVDDTGKSRTILNGEDVEDEIRSMQVADNVSPVAAIPEVRSLIVDLLQKMGRSKGIVMDGRDIGTTVFPSAEMKIFVDASPEVRAGRRLAELKAKGLDVNYDDVYRNICERDHIDRTRKESPLRKADDAISLANDNMTLADQEKWLLDKFNEITGKKS